MMSYRFSYPLYLDVSEHHKQNHFNGNNRIHAYQREDNTSPTTAMMNLNAFYESMLASGHNAASFLNARSHITSLPVQFNQYFNSQHNQSEKLSSVCNASKSSFSIEAILGINRQNSNYLMVKDDNEYDLNEMKLRANYKLANEMSPKTTNYIKANSIASVSPDSTAKEQNLIRYNQRPKNKILPSNVINSQINNNNKRSIDCVDGSEMKPNKTIAKIEICQRLGQNSISQGKSKRVRTIFTPEQLEKLEVEFERQQYMVGPERLYLASALNLSEAQVKVWFQNRRIKWRKQHLEMQQARFGKQCITSDEVSGDVTTDDDGEHETRSFQTVQNDEDSICHSPNSVNVLN